MHIGAHAWSFQPTVHPSIRHPYLAPNQFYPTDFCMEFKIIVCSFSAFPLPNSISLLITSASDRERTHPSCPAYPHPHPHQFLEEKQHTHNSVTISVLVPWAISFK